MADFPFFMRSEVASFSPYVAGLSIDEIREKYGLETVVKMASNEAPLGTSPVVREAVARAASMAFRYPQSGNPRLVKAIAKHHGVPPALVVAGNGSDEIIDLLVRVCPTPGVHNVVANKPCFSLYGLQSRFCGVEFRQAPVKNDFSFDWEALLALVDENTALVFITTPDNPSGWCPQRGDVIRFARALPERCLLVVDEAYMDFCSDEAAHSLLPMREDFDNLVILRTFSKSFGLAGLRIGYGIMPEELAQALMRVHPPFSVNILAEEAALAALSDTAFRELTLETVREGRRYLSKALSELGCKVFPSEANFIMFIPPERGKYNAYRIFENLLAKGLIIRPLKSYGLPDCLRVSVGSEDENRLFISLLSEVLNS